MSGQYVNAGPPYRLMATLLLIELSITSALRAQEVNEVEPNEAIANAIALGYSHFGAGQIQYAPTLNPDVWASPVQVGHLIFAYVDTQESAGNMDSNLVIDSNDNVTQLVYDEDDGAPGPTPSSVVAGVVAIQAGYVYHTIGGSSGQNLPPISYRFYQAVLNPMDSAAEQENNNVADSANPISASIMFGEVSGGDVDMFATYADIGTRLVVIMDDNPDKDGQLTDTDLSIVASDGATVLASGDNVASGININGNVVGDANAAGGVVAPATGIYYVRVAHGGDVSAPDTDYRFVFLAQGAPVGVGKAKGACCLSDGTCQSNFESTCKAAGGQWVGANSDCAFFNCETQADSDDDGVANASDNCIAVANADQADADGDGVGDACEDSPPDGQAPSCGACGSGFAVMMPMLILTLLGMRRHLCADQAAARIPASSSI